MVATLIVMFLVLFLCVVFEIPAYVIVLAVIGIIAFAVLIIWLDKKELSVIDKVVSAELLNEVAVYKEKIENTGFSIGYSWHSGRSYYRYKKVLDHYDCYFKVVYADGSTGTKKCKKGSNMYNELILKCRS
ncbi:MAG: hypothetical protein E7667_03065 [Ruminococcaceae bacterium]|nr:hypothetical protein [Oscillospiraceae bacterium]